MVMKIMKTVACGISGGVDSAVSAYLLKKYGYNVLGVFMKNWDVRDEYGFCYADSEFQHAEYISKHLGIKLIEANFVKDYWNDVFSELIRDYQNGLTPNPDILCNKKIKFKSFYDHCIQKLKVDFIATGHYARTSKNNKNGVKLLKARDSTKDQTFFLSQIQQNALQRTLFPLGDLTKIEVKQIASDIGLQKIASKKESTGICFIGKRNFKHFISDYVDPKPGKFLDIESGNLVGTHDGIHCWTVGQGCHIGGKSTAYFIVSKNVENQDILVAPSTNHPSLFHDMIETEMPHFIHSMPEVLSYKTGVLNCDFRFQHTDKLINCVLHKDEDKWFVQFDHYIRALTPGQYAVLYLGEECLGSARILKTGPSLFDIKSKNRFEKFYEFY